MNSYFIPKQIFKSFFWSGLVIVLILIIGTIGYYFIGGKNYTWINCLYMTVLTVTTVGFSEIVDMSNNPGGRIFTMVIAFSGLGIYTFIISNITSLNVLADIKQSYQKRKMEKSIKKFENHYIVCGAGRVGRHIIEELNRRGLDVVVVDNDESILNDLSETHPEMNYVKGIADDEKVLENASIRKAKGIFASTGEDSENLVITLTAKQLNPQIKVVARCLVASNKDKFLRAGAEVIRENYSAALRMYNTMITPKGQDVLDKIMSDSERNLLVEEFELNSKYTGKSVADLHLSEFPNTLLMAIGTEGKWQYIPKQDFIIQQNSKIIVFTTQEDRQQIEEAIC
jgi:voltage-gated potassium channel